MIDLTRATNCIRIMKEYGIYRGEKIGRIREEVNGLTSAISGVPCYQKH